MTLIMVGAQWLNQVNHHRNWMAVILLMEESGALNLYENNYEPMSCIGTNFQLIGPRAMGPIICYCSIMRTMGLLLVNFEQVNVTSYDTRGRKSEVIAV